jgi:hypothetical protein
VNGMAFSFGRDKNIKWKHGVNARDRSLLFLFFLLGNSARSRALPPGEEQRSAIVPSGCNIPKQKRTLTIVE